MCNLSAKRFQSKMCIFLSLLITIKRIKLFFSIFFACNLTWWDFANSWCLCNIFDALKDLSKQPLRGVLRKKCSENMQQISWGASMPKCDFNKVALQLYWNPTSAWMFSIKFATNVKNDFSQGHIWTTGFRFLKSKWEIFLDALSQWLLRLKRSNNTS